eukprot:146072_1
MDAMYDNISNQSNGSILFESTAQLELNHTTDSFRTTAQLHSNPTTIVFESTVLNPLQNMSKLELLNAIQEIENTIYFDTTYHNTTNDSIFSTGTSPHFYDGPFSFNKTCKMMRFQYFCPGYIIEQHAFNRWSMSMHNIRNLSNNTRHILPILQEHYRRYNHNTHHQLQHIIHSQQSVFSIKRNLNILIYGNSHMKQIVLGFICTLMDIDPSIIVKITPTMRYLNDTTAHPYANYNFKDRFCLDAALEGMIEANQRGQNGLHLSNATIYAMYERENVEHGIYHCTVDYLHVELANDCSIYYIFSNRQEQKSLYNETKAQWNIRSFDLIIFNLGNGPPYSLDALEYDLVKLQHTKKPIVFHRTWYELYERYLIWVEKRLVLDWDKINNLRKRYPFLIYI